MAIFKNPPPEGFIFPALSEKKFIQVLSDLPSKWMFWYEPTLHGGQTPDFVLWVPAEEFAAIFLIELKNWRRTFVSRADMTYVYLRNNRVEYNPISKLKMVRNNLNEALTMHYRAAPGLEKIAVIPLLLHWAIEPEETHELLQHDHDVAVRGKSVTQDAEKLCLELIQLAQGAYRFIDEEPPVISGSIKRAILSCVDLSIRAHSPGGRFAPVPPAAPPVVHQAESPPKVGTNGTAAPAHPPSPGPAAAAKPAPPAKRKYDQPLSPLLDDLQHAVINNRSLGHCLLSGVPGTGKTIILLGRLRWYARHYPNSRQLFIVHQKVLINNLRQRYQHQFAGGKPDRNIHFFRFKDWFTQTYQDVNEYLRTYAQEQTRRLDELVDEALAGKLPLRPGAIDSYDYVYVDEAHQMPTRWIKLLTQFARPSGENKPNIWIAYDNGQGIYQNRRFEGHAVGLNFQGRSRNFHRVYRCGLLPWVFAACCHPEAFRTYRAQNSGEYLEFTHMGRVPLAIVQPTLAQQAARLAEAIGKKVAKKEFKLSDVTIFYAVAGMSEQEAYPDEETKKALDDAFAPLGGIEWVAIYKARADWTSERVRACTFTSSQGIDAPVAVLFGAETFKMFANSDWVDPDALFYTVLTRSTHSIILTYNHLQENAECRFESALFRGSKKASKILPILETLKPQKASDDTAVYRIKWAQLDLFVNS